MRQVQEDSLVQGVRPHLLFLAHRIPYPPTKGDKIRSYHLLVHLAKRFRVHLGTFVDDPADLPFADQVQEYCESTAIFRVRPLVQRLKGLRALITGESITVPYYRDARLQSWVNATVDRFEIGRVLAYSSSMAQYVLGQRFERARKVIDFVDVDSDKWQQYATSKPAITAWIYRREAAKLAAFERLAASGGGLNTFVSEAEAEYFRRVSADCRSRIVGVPNGVDAGFFAPDPGFECPFPVNTRRIVFTGAMDYWANADAVMWFARDVFPAIKRRFPNVLFYIVGRNPSREVRKLASEGVVITGSVSDVRPFLQYADVAVAPMRIARGIQNKILEAMSMGRPVVATARGVEGIDARDGKEILVASDEQALALQVARVLSGQEGEMGARARQKVICKYNWNVNLRIVAEYLYAAR
jgi:sugar transferase (PEP-CTERM/EpsH1 system associated)